MKELELFGSVRGCRVGDGCDAVASEELTDRGKVGGLSLGKPVSQPTVRAKKSSGGSPVGISLDRLGVERIECVPRGRGGVDRVEGELFNRARVEKPHDAAAMLDPNGNVASNLIEAMSIEGPRDGFEIASASDPASIGCRVA
jgi:hypothetical protein